MKKGLQEQVAIAKARRDELWEQMKPILKKHDEEVKDLRHEWHTLDQFVQGAEKWLV